MTYHRALAALAAASVVTLTFAGTIVRAEDNYPSHPLQMIIPFAAGGPTDIVGRIMGAKMSEVLGQSIVVEDRGGAGGTIGAAEVAKAAPDGYTLLMATVSTNAINPALYRHLPYNSATAFAPVGRIGVTPTILLANLSVPAPTSKA